MDNSVAAGGKPAWEIRIFPNRSVDTVRLHLKNAKHELGAASMAHAIAKSADVDDPFVSSVKVVAGARTQRYLQLNEAWL